MVALVLVQALQVLQRPTLVAAVVANGQARETLVAAVLAAAGTVCKTALAAVQEQTVWAAAVAVLGLRLHASAAQAATAL
jgi:hypothetical protein